MAPDWQALQQLHDFANKAAVDWVIHYHECDGSWHSEIWSMCREENFTSKARSFRNAIDTACEHLQKLAGGK